MVEAARAAVPPRVAVGGGEDVELLEEVVAELLGSGARGLVEIVGPPGSGKTAALAHLAHLYAGEERLVFEDPVEDPADAATILPEGRLVLRTRAAPCPGADPARNCRLAPWDRDDLVEYLLARGPERCASVVGRLPADDPFDGVPEVWAAALDRMADDPDVPGPGAALRDLLREILRTDRRWRKLCRHAFAVIRDPGRDAEPDPAVRRLVRHPAVLGLLAADRLVETLDAGRVPRSIPAALADGLAARIEPGSRAGLLLAGVLAGPPDPRQVAAAEVLHRADPAGLRRALDGRVATGDEPMDLRGARLAGADWRGIRLVSADLRDARLAGADLRAALLVLVDLTRTDLEGADLTDARLVRCDADRLRADRTRLRGAWFSECFLRRARIEGLESPGADFRESDLARSDLTGSVMPGADLSGANLSRTALAGVRWRGANLRGADLTRAAFHLGTTRSGLLESPIASEGTRTGFYTDDRETLRFRDPADVRTADLREADLREAKLLETDLYLVDLRGARMDPALTLHARRCGAIL